MKTKAKTVTITVTYKGNDIRSITSEGLSKDLEVMNRQGAAFGQYLSDYAQALRLRGRIKESEGHIRQWREDLEDRVTALDQYKTGELPDSKQCLRPENARDDIPF